MEGWASGRSGRRRWRWWRWGIVRLVGYYFTSCSLLIEIVSSSELGEVVYDEEGRKRTVRGERLVEEGRGRSQWHFSLR